MGLPEVNIKLGTGGLGRPAQNDDGVSAMILPGVTVGTVVLETKLGPFYGLSQVEALGITEAYDTTNSVLAWHHVRDFYKMAGEGTELYLMLVSKTKTWSEILSKTGTIAPVFINACEGKIRLLAASSLAADCFAAIKTNCEAAQAIADDCFDKFKPLSIILDGSGLTAPIDLRSSSAGPVAKNVLVVISQDKDYSTLPGWVDSTHIGLILGSAAGLAVNRNIGRVRNGAVDITDEPRLSDGDLLSEKTAADLIGYDAQGYIFLRKIDGKAGYFWNNDHTATVISSDYAYLNKVRIINKAARIVRAVYIEELLNDVEIDPSSGKLSPEVIKAFQQECDSQMNINMKDEVSGAKCFVDPDQDVVSTDKIEAKLKIVPHGMLKEIEVTIGFSKTL